MPKAEYDPQARREYYLRTRELKGREKGAKKDYLSAVVKRDKPATDKQIDSAQEKVQQIAAKLDRLRALLREKTAASKSSSDGKQNHAQKEAAKKDSKEYYDKHKEQIKNNREKGGKGGGSSTPSGGASSMDADELRSAIRRTVGQLKEAIAKARQLKGG